MVSVAILGILLAIAIPSYRSYVLRSQRSEAYQALLAVEQRQQRYYLFNSAYSSSMTTLGLSSQSTASQYAIALTANGNAYTATATAQGKQASDTACSSLTIKVDSVASGAVYSPANCWGS